MSAAVETRVDFAETDRLLAAGRDAVARLVDALAADLAAAAAVESRPASRRVSEAWHVADTRTPGERRVAVTAAAFFAHFLARGTRGHGPRNAPRLVFRVAGNWVSPAAVAGVAADPFHERAIVSVRERASSTLDGLIAQAYG